MPRRILIVEDDENIRLILSELLEQIDCEISAAKNGREAIEYLSGDLPDAMLLDLNMPEVDGFAVLEWLAEQGLTDQVRTMIVTARGRSEDLSRAFNLGAKDYLLKPFEPRTVFLRVARLLIRSKGELDARTSLIAPDAADG